MLIVVQQREPRVSTRLRDSQLPCATELVGTYTPAVEELTDLSFPRETERYFFFSGTFPGVLFNITASGKYRSLLPCFPCSFVDSQCSFPCSFLDSQCSLLRPCLHKHLQSVVGRRHWSVFFLTSLQVGGTVLCFPVSLAAFWIPVFFAPSVSVQTSPAICGPPPLA